MIGIVLGKRKGDYKVKKKDLRVRSTSITTILQSREDFPPFTNYYYTRFQEITIRWSSGPRDGGNGCVKSEKNIVFKLNSTY